MAVIYVYNLYSGKRTDEYLMLTEGHDNSKNKKFAFVNWR